MRRVDVHGILRVLDPLVEHPAAAEGDGSLTAHDAVRRVVRVHRAAAVADVGTRRRFAEMPHRHTPDDVAVGVLVLVYGLLVESGDVTAPRAGGRTAEADPLILLTAAIAGDVVTLVGRRIC
jgi:DNA-directed RNA polymerase subunit H (RpoH/RPB5)